MTSSYWQEEWFQCLVQRNVETVTSDWSVEQTRLWFDDSDNDVVIDFRGTPGQMVVTDSAHATTWRMKTQSNLFLELAGGNDALTVRSRSNTPENETTSVFGRGSDGNDTLRGSEWPESFSGGTGDDSLLGLAGDDWLDGESGNDVLDGGAGFDWGDVWEGGNLILGQTTSEGTDSGSDTFRGMEKFDVSGSEVDQRFEVTGFPGEVEMRGNGGNDTLIGGSNNDWLIGGEGNDVLIGRGGDDQLSGQNQWSHDVNFSVPDHDVLFGGAGRDMIFAGPGQDTVAGGDGIGARDTLAESDSGDTIAEGEIVFESYDASLAWLDTGWGGIDVAPNPQLVIVPPSAWDDGGLTVTRVEDLIHVYRTGTEIDVVTPLVSSPEIELRMIGREQESDALTLDLETWDLPSGRDSMPPTMPKMVFWGGRGRGSDIVTMIGDWRAEVELSMGMLSSEIVFQGVGQFQDVELVNSRLEFAESFVLGETDDIVTIERPSPAGETIVSVNVLSLGTTIRFEFRSLTLLDTGDGNDRVTIHQDWSGDSSDVAQLTVRGGTGDDTLIGQAGNDQLWGEGGNDLLIGGEGNDYLDGSEGDNTVLGGAGNDNVYSGNGSDSIAGGDGNDYLSGGGGADFLDGGEGNDELSGDDQGNTLLGQAGNDTLWGGTGDELLDGGSGNDSLYGVDGRNTLLGQAGNDELWGGPGDELIDGGSGRDRLNGYEGHDSLLGGAGHDLLSGGLGDDRLDGGRGTDLLIGGTQSWQAEPGDRFLNGELDDESYSYYWYFVAPHDEYDASQTVVIDASLWTSAGLTVRVVSDEAGDELLLQVVRSDTGEEVIPAIVVYSVDYQRIHGAELLQINGRDHARDVLTIELSYWTSFNSLRLRFNGGVGNEDAVVLTGDDVGEVQFTAESVGGGFITLADSRLLMDYHQVESLQDQSLTSYKAVQFGAGTNHIAFDDATETDNSPAIQTTSFISVSPAQDTQLSDLFPNQPTSGNPLIAEEWAANIADTEFERAEQNEAQRELGLLFSNADLIAELLDASLPTSL